MNVVAWDLVMNFFFSNSETVSDTGSYRFATIFVTAFITALTCVWVGLVCRAVFRWGNRRIARGLTKDKRGGHWGKGAHDRWTHRRALATLATSWAINLGFFAWMMWTGDPATRRVPEPRLSTALHV